MKTSKLTICLFTCFLLFSCQGANSELYRQAAQETCACVEHLRHANPEEQPQNDGLRYALCTLEIEKSLNIDVQDDAFETALKVHCPAMFKVHDNVVNNSIQIQNQTPH